jgi:hypothetical protein
MNLSFSTVVKWFFLLNCREGGEKPVPQRKLSAKLLLAGKLDISDR